jgi:hypothetical protein
MSALGWIVLQNSAFANEQNFPEALARLSKNCMGSHMTDPISNRQLS